MDFDKSIFDYAQDRTVICAHRGLSGGNVPCNTLTAFSAALMAGADMVELDVSKSVDGKFYVFHPGMEPAHLRSKRYIASMKAKTVDRKRYVNQDNAATHYRVNTLDEIFAFLKGKCYINVDKFWTDIEGISEAVRRAGVEKQVIVKTPVKDEYLEKTGKYASDFMFMPVVRNRDDITAVLRERGINCIGAEVLFEKDDEPVAGSEYIDMMHSRGMLVFANAIIYNSHDVIAADHTDDRALSGDPDDSWGNLIDRGFDIIQTDHCGLLKNYISSRGK